MKIVLLLISLILLYVFCILLWGLYLGAAKGLYKTFRK